MKTGRIIPNGIVLTAHEYATITVLTNHGLNVELLRPSLTKNVKTGDFMMEGKIWEMKSPTGKSKSTMEHIFQKAARQAHNIVVDLRRTKILDRSTVQSLERVFATSRSVKNLWIINKNSQIIKLKK